MGSYPFVSTAPSVPWLDSDNALLVANSDPWLPASSFVLIAGSVYLAKLIPRTTITIANLWFVLATSGSGASTGSFAGLYSAAGSLLSGSADQGAAFAAAAGPFSVPLTTPQLVNAGTFVWAAIISNLAVTQPGIQRAAAQASAGNLNLSASLFRFAINGTALSALPASITPASNVGTAGGNLWAGGN
jgi:hypothetical protein